MVAVSNSHGARPVHQITSMVKWIRTSCLSMKNSLSLGSLPRKRCCYSWPGADVTLNRDVSAAHIPDDTNEGFQQPKLALFSGMPTFHNLLCGMVAVSVASDAATDAATAGREQSGDLSFPLSLSHSLSFSISLYLSPFRFISLSLRLFLSLSLSFFFSLSLSISLSIFHTHTYIHTHTHTLHCLSFSLSLSFRTPRPPWAIVLFKSRRR